jgi:hypothetical protein
MAGYWKAPRELVRLLAERKLTPNEYAILHFVGEAGNDQHGLATSIGFLAEVFGVQERTIRRALRGLRAHGLIAYDDHPGIAMFVVRISPKLEALTGVASDEPRTAPRTAPRTSETEVVSDPTSDTPPPTNSRKPASAKGLQGVPTSDTPPRKKRSETETEIDTKTTTPPGGRADARQPSTELELRSKILAPREPGPQALVAYFVTYCRELGAEPAESERGHLGRIVASLARQFPAEVIEAAIRLMVDRNLNPAALPSLMREAQLGPARPRNEHIADQMARRLAQRRDGL